MDRSSLWKRLGQNSRRVRRPQMPLHILLTYASSSWVMSSWATKSRHIAAHNQLEVWCFNQSYLLQLIQLHQKMAPVVAGEPSSVLIRSINTCDLTCANRRSSSGSGDYHNQSTIALEIVFMTQYHHRWRRVSLDWIEHGSSLLWQPVGWWRRPVSLKQKAPAAIAIPIPISWKTAKKLRDKSWSVVGSKMKFFMHFIGVVLNLKHVCDSPQ